MKPSIFTENTKINVMKKNLFTLFLLSISYFSEAQYQTYQLEYNNASARLRNNGVLFNNHETNRPGYRVPYNSGPELIYASSFWFGGKDFNDNLGFAGMMYGMSGNDFQPGPYSTNSSYSNSQYTSKYNSSIWIVNNYEINQHIQNWDSEGYVMPLSIANWPGNGDTTLGIAQHLAPFVDLNYNGIYEPELGEYPSIKDCEQSVYMILNDDRVHTETMGERMGIEIHYIFYQYATTDFLNNTTLVDVVVHNRGTKNWMDFKIGMFLDPDLGNSTDDYVGCNPDKNLSFAYNADNNDETNGGVFGFGNNPPAFGVISLNKDLSAFVSYADFGVVTGPPSTASGCWNNLNGFYTDGTQILDMNNDPTKHIFSGDPNESNSDSEYQQGNMPGDRRVVSGYDMDDFAPGSSQKLSLAIIYNRDGDHLQNVTGLFAIADSIQTLYDNGTIGCETEFPENLNIETKETSQFVMYPNPASGMTTIQLQENTEGTIRVYSLDGSEILTTPIQGIETTINTEKMSEGIYLIDLISKTTTFKKVKLVVTR